MNHHRPPPVNATHAQARPTTTTTTTTTTKKDSINNTSEVPITTTVNNQNQQQQASSLRSAADAEKNDSNSNAAVETINIFHNAIRHAQNRFGKDIILDKTVMDLVRYKRERESELEKQMKSKRKRRMVLEVLNKIDQKKNYELIVVQYQKQVDSSKLRVNAANDTYKERVREMQNENHVVYQSLRIKELNSYFSASLEALTKSCIKALIVLQNRIIHRNKLSDRVAQIVDEEERIKQELVLQQNKHKVEIDKLEVMIKKYEEALNLYEEELQRRIDFSERIYPIMKNLDLKMISPSLRFMLDLLDKDRLRLDRSFDSFFISNFVQPLYSDLSGELFSYKDDKRHSIIDRTCISCPTINDPSTVFGVIDNDNDTDLSVDNTLEADFVNISNGTEMCVYYSDFSV